MTPTVEFRLILAAHIVQELRDTAQARGVSEAAVVEQALDLLFGLDDPSPLQD